MSQKRPHSTIEEKPKSAYQKYTEGARRAFVGISDQAKREAEVFERAKPLIMGKSLVEREKRVSRALVTALDQLMDTDEEEMLSGAISSNGGPFGLWFSRQFGDMAFSWERSM